MCVWHTVVLMLLEQNFKKTELDFFRSFKQKIKKKSGATKPYFLIGIVDVIPMLIMFEYITAIFIT